MKQVLLLVAIHLLIYHQYQKDKKEQNFFTPGKTEAAIKKEQKNNLNALLKDLQVNENDSSFFYMQTDLLTTISPGIFLFSKKRSKFHQSKLKVQDKKLVI